MFRKLKNRLKNWTKGLTEKAEDIEGEKPEEILEKRQFEEKNPEIAKKSPTEKIDESEKITKKEEVEEEKPEIIKESLPEKIDEILIEEKPVEEVKEEPLLKEDKEKKSLFNKITSKIKKVRVSEKDFKNYSEELEMLLLENNVALEVAEKIIKRLEEEIVGKEILRKEIEHEIKDVFKKIINEILIEPFDLIKKIKEKKDKPYIVLFCGINGTGKTTTIAKIAQKLKENNLTCVLAAGDTFRAASIEQLKTHGKKLGVEVIAHEYNSDPASVGFDAIKYAKKKDIDCVLIDTAGRMHTSKNLMSQIEKIAKVTKPDTKIFVGESITGNDILEQVKSFDEAIELDGIILTKADIDEKGGTALSVGYITKKPILYLGTGQKYDEIEPFNKEKFIEKLGLDEA